MLVKTIGESQTRDGGKRKAGATTFGTFIVLSWIYM